MGFTKQIEKPSGMLFNYHRIVSVVAITNMQNIIEVGSYASAKKRQDEIECAARMTAGDTTAEPTVLVDATYISCPYDPTMTVDSAYEYILSLPDYEGAVMDEAEYTAGAEERVEEIKAELAEQQQQSDIQQPHEEGDVE